jgi:hypothetical protein
MSPATTSPSSPPLSPREARRDAIQAALGKVQTISTLAAELATDGVLMAGQRERFDHMSGMLAMENAILTNLLAELAEGPTGKPSKRPPCPQCKELMSFQGSHDRNGRRRRNYKCENCGATKITFPDAEDNMDTEGDGSFSTVLRRLP